MESAAAPRVDFLGLPLLRITTGEYIDLLCRAAKTPHHHPAWFTYINAWCTVIAMRDSNYTRLLQQADGVYADGKAIVWASQVLGRPVPERVNAADFIVEFCRRCAAEDISLYLVGSAPGVAEQAANEWRRQVPGLSIRGAESGYTHGLDSDVLKRIKDVQPDVLLVGMGVPRQEEWVAANLDQISARVVWCVGAMFEYHGKARARAPVWMRRAGLEWLFRLVLEPRRLARRYLLGNLQFIYYVLRARLRKSRQS